MAKKGVFESLVPRGENPNGVTVVTNNGVAHARGDGFNQGTGGNQDGPRWNAGIKPAFDGIFGTTPGSASPRRNRTGE